jgi:hypothetical protein
VLVVPLLAALAICHGSAGLPDRACTPGAVQSRDTAAVCTAGWSSAHRHVTYAQRRRLFAAYAIPWSQRSSYRLDHLVPLEIGGANTDANLFPQPLVWSYRKDKVEDALHDLVCDGAMKIRTAQARVARNWKTALPTRSMAALAPPPMVEDPGGGGCWAWTWHIETRCAWYDVLHYSCDYVVVWERVPC